MQDVNFWRKVWQDFATHWSKWYAAIVVGAALLLVLFGGGK